MGKKHEMYELKQYQSLPLSAKIAMTQQRVNAWVEHWGIDGVVVSLSGGKDSTVLLHIVREMYPEVKAAFFDTGLEYPEIRDFVKTFVNVDWIKPKMTFRKVIEKYGYPMISKEVSECIHGARICVRDMEQGISSPRYAYSYSKLNGTGDYSREDKAMFSCKKYQYFLDAPFEIGNYCCRIMKKNPAHEYTKTTGRKQMTAQTASESRLRTQKWLMHGCNGFDMKYPISNPMAFWTEQDVLLYIYLYGPEMLDARKAEYKAAHPELSDAELQAEFSGKEWRPICSIYGDVIDLREKDELDGQLTWQDLGLFDLGKPILDTTGAKRTGCMFCGYGCHHEKPGEGRFERIKVTHPKTYEYIMKPWDKGGLGYKEVIDWINEHGKLNIRY